MQRPLGAAEGSGPEGAAAALEGVFWDEATEDAVRARGDGPTQASTETARAAQARAQALVRQGAPSLEGLRDMQLLAQAMGLPVPRILFAEMLEKSSASLGQKQKFRRELADMTPLTETGCVSVEFRGPGADLPQTAYLVLEKCPADHDLSAQLDPLYAKIPPSRQEEIRQNLSMLVYLGRSTFRQMLETKTRVLAEIARKLPPGFDPADLQVDPANTTLFLPPPCAARVGIFVRYEGDLDDSSRGAGSRGGAPPAP